MDVFGALPTSLLLKKNELHAVSIKSCGVYPSNMQECRVCGLLFGGGDRCPECKSVFGTTIEIDEDETLPTGPLPGADSLAEILPEVEGLSSNSPNLSKSISSLPFTLGGARASPKVQLLFGAGTRADLRIESDEKSEFSSLEKSHNSIY